MKPEQYDDGVMALKRAAKTTKPYFWWFCPSDGEGEAALLVGKKEGEIRAAAKAARKEAKDKKFGFGRVMPTPDGVLGFGIDAGSVRPKQMQRALVTSLAKAPGFKAVKGLLVRAKVLTAEEFAELAAEEGAESEGEESKPVAGVANAKRLLKALNDARNRAKAAFGEARAAGADPAAMEGFKVAREAADALAKRASALMEADAEPEKVLELLRDATDGFDELADACKVAAAPSDDSVGAAEVPTVDVAALNRTWLDAYDEVQSQLNRLAAELRKSGDEDLIDIADKGLARLADGRRVKFQAALMNAQQVKPEGRAEAFAVLADAADDFQDWLDKSEEVAVVDDNPFGIPVSVRATLGGALKSIAAAL